MRLMCYYAWRLTLQVACHLKVSKCQYDPLIRIRAGFQAPNRGLVQFDNNSGFSLSTTETNLGYTRSGRRRVVRQSRHNEAKARCSRERPTPTRYMC